jgi:hypothetical protein
MNEIRFLPVIRLVKGFAALLVFSLIASAPVSANCLCSINFFPASDYNSNTGIMNTTLGITGNQFDSFESISLLPGLTISMSGDSVPSPVTLTSLANVYNVNSLPQTTNNNWDGSGALVNNPLNQVTSAGATDFSKLITFNYSPGTTSFGVGLSNFQSPNSPSFPITDHDLFVNGIDEGSIEVLAGADWSPGLGRNAYMVITATNGSVIDSVGFQNDSAVDALLFDHLAVSPSVSAAPEPSAYALFSIGALMFAGFLWRKP